MRLGAPRAVVAGTLGGNPERRAMTSKTRSTTKTAKTRPGRQRAHEDPQVHRHSLRQRRRETGWAGEAWPALRAGGWASTTPRRTRGARAEPGRGSLGEHGERRDSGLLLARRAPGSRLGGGRMIDSRPADHQAVLRSDHRRGRRQGGATADRALRTFSLAVNYKEEGRARSAGTTPPIGRAFRGRSRRAIASGSRAPSACAVKRRRSGRRSAPSTSWI